MANKYFAKKNAENLALALIKVGDLYPSRLATERDFQPAAAAHIAVHFPGLKIEVGNSNKKIDFRVGGTNPSLIELAVQPRELVDPNHQSLHFSGFAGKSTLYPAANKAELRKLRNDSKATARYLLLLDFRGPYDPLKLFWRYQGFAAQHLSGKPNIRVVYARGTAAPFLFSFWV